MSKLLAIASSSGTATIAVPSGTTKLNHVSITNITFTGGTVEAYDATDGGGNTGVTFKRPNKLSMSGVG